MTTAILLKLLYTLWIIIIVICVLGYSTIGNAKVQKILTITVGVFGALMILTVIGLIWV